MSPNHNTGHDTSALPEPSELQKAHSRQLGQLIQQVIREAGGHIGFDRFMAMALYQPGLGYYAAGSQKFGARGDFITAPEVSPLFARSLARQCQQVFAELTQPVLIEFGAGSGVLAADLLLELEALGCLPSRYLIIELSADLQQRQRQKIAELCPHLATRVSWCHELPAEKVEGVILANEVIDAMPVKVFEKRQDGLFECAVSAEHGIYSWVTMPADASIVQAVAEIEASTGQPVATGYRSEYNPSVLPWLRSLRAMLSRGLVLLIDYGYDAAQYYSAERNMGTLVCFYQHRAHDNVFFAPGLQDITAFVDFTAVAEAALVAGFEVMGYTTQAQFLFGCGLPEIFENQVAALAQGDVKAQLSLSQQVKTLTLPGEMGERFKVMALGVEIEPGLAGFSLADYRTRL